MKTNGNLKLLSKDAKELGYENIKDVFDKVIKIDLDLGKELKEEISEISHSLGIILSKNLNKKKARFDIKLKKGSDIIDCDKVSIVLDKSNDLLIELLGTDTKDEIVEEIELAGEEVIEKKIDAGKSDKKRQEYVESIRYKNELKKKLENIIVLEEIIKSINNFRKRLNDLIDLEKDKKEVILSNDCELKKEDKVEKDNNEIIIESKKEEVKKIEDKVEKTKNDKLSSELDLFNFEELELIKINLKNKKIELPKQNSLYSEVKEYFLDEKRLTFYHLGLYKLITGFKNNKCLDIYNAVNIIGLLDVNTLCEFFIEGRLGNSDEVKLSVLGVIFKNSIRLKEEYYSLGKALHFNLLKNQGRGTVNDIRYKYNEFLRIIEKRDNEILDFDLDSISFLEISESTEVREKLEVEYREETFNVKKSKIGVVRKVRSSSKDSIQELIDKKKKLTKAYNIDKYKKIFGRINAEKFKEFFEIDKEYFLKVGSIEIIDLYILALNRLKDFFTEEEFNNFNRDLKQFIILIKNGVKNIKVDKNKENDKEKEKLLLKKGIELHLENFLKNGEINSVFQSYLDKNINDNNFLIQLVECLLNYSKTFIGEFLEELAKFYDIRDIKLLLEEKGQKHY